MKASLFHFFSKFSTELLLLEGLAILLLTAFYAAFYALRKRRLGHVDRDVPGPIVKAYLNQLIGEAEAMRAQLFGLLAGAAGSKTLAPVSGSVDTAALLAALQANPGAAAAGASAEAADPALLQKVQSLETKMGEQTKNLQTVVVEKERIEKELAALKAGGAAASNPDGSGASSSDMADLQEKLAALESKLAEYSIIEDDLANLKRLQQENAQLRAALAGQGGTLPVAEAAPAPAPDPAAAKEPAPAEPAEPAVAAAPPPVEAAADPVVLAEAQAEPPAAAAPEATFEGLVDQVEQSLQTPETQLSAATTSNELEKSDADLVEEFEKMLNA